MHHHIMLKDRQTGKNVFMVEEDTDDTDDEKKDDDNDRNSADNRRLSPICKYGIAGLLKYADDITAAFASSQETFDRLKPGFEAPIYKSWGYSNRSALVRVPKSSKETTRFEYRGGDLSGSVHIFGALLLNAVLKGIEQKLELPPCADYNVETLSQNELDQKNLYPVPLDFNQCIKVLQTSTFLKETLGPNMVQYLIQRDIELLKKEQAIHAAQRKSS